jgi:hypothetical protein
MSANDPLNGQSVSAELRKRFKLPTKFGSFSISGLASEAHVGKLAVVATIKTVRASEMST